MHDTMEYIVYSTVYHYTMEYPPWEHNMRYSNEDTHDALLNE